MYDTMKENGPRRSPGDAPRASIQRNGLVPCCLMSPASGRMRICRKAPFYEMIAPKYGIHLDSRRVCGPDGLCDLAASAFDAASLLRRRQRFECRRRLADMMTMKGKGRTHGASDGMGSDDGHSNSEVAPTLTREQLIRVFGEYWDGQDLAAAQEMANGDGPHVFHAAHVAPVLLEDLAQFNISRPTIDGTGHAGEDGGPRKRGRGTQNQRLKTAQRRALVKGLTAPDVVTELLGCGMFGCWYAVRRYALGTIDISSELDDAAALWGRRCNGSGEKQAHDGDEGGGDGASGAAKAGTRVRLSYSTNDKDVDACELTSNKEGITLDDLEMKAAEECQAAVRRTVEMLKTHRIFLRCDKERWTITCVPITMDCSCKAFKKNLTQEPFFTCKVEKKIKPTVNEHDVDHGAEHGGHTPGEGSTPLRAGGVDGDEMVEDEHPNGREGHNSPLGEEGVTASVKRMNGSTVPAATVPANEESNKGKAQEPVQQETNTRADKDSGTFTRRPDSHQDYDLRLSFKSVRDAVEYTIEHCMDDLQAPRVPPGMRERNAGETPIKLSVDLWDAACIPVPSPHVDCRLCIQRTLLSNEWVSLGRAVQLQFRTRMYPRNVAKGAIGAESLRRQLERDVFERLAHKPFRTQSTFMRTLEDPAATGDENNADNGGDKIASEGDHAVDTETSETGDMTNQGDMMDAPAVDETDTAR